MDSRIPYGQGDLCDSDVAVCTFILAQLFSARSKRLDEDAIGKGKKGKNDHIEIARSLMIIRRTSELKFPDEYGNE